jgi:hypothetical protein
VKYRHYLKINKVETQSDTKSFAIIQDHALGGGGSNVPSGMPWPAPCERAFFCGWLILGRHASDFFLPLLVLRYIRIEGPHVPLSGMLRKSFALYWNETPMNGHGSRILRRGIFFDLKSRLRTYRWR